MAIAFGYQPISTLKEGFDAISEYQRLKLSKAMALLQSGSQFGQKEAIGEGFGYLGSKSAKNYTNEAPTKQNVGAVDYSTMTQKDIQGMEYEKLNDIDTINQIVYSAKDLPEAKNKLALIAKTIADKKGGIDMNTAVQLATMDEGLETHYGRGSKGSNINWASLIAQPKRGAGGAKLKDYTVISPDGTLKFIAASNIEEAYNKAKKQVGDGTVFEGDTATVTKNRLDWQKELLSNEATASALGLKVKDPIFGSPYLINKKTGEQVTDDELNRMFATIYAKGKEVKKKNMGITQIKPK